MPPGGAAALWKRTTNPWGAIGAGPVMAQAAGADLADLERSPKPVSASSSDRVSDASANSSDTMRRDSRANMASISAPLSGKLA